MLKKLLEWDRDTFIYLNNLGIDDHDVFWTAVTTISNWTPLFLLFIVLLIYKYGKVEGLYKVLTLLVMLLFVLSLTYLTKEWVARLRPNNDTQVNTLIRILQSPHDYSFFSGHAASSFSITTLVYLFLRKKMAWTWVFFLWPILFALSRIFVGVHFPIDILVGMLVGITSAALFYKFHKSFIGKIRLGRSEGR
ncbi:phosphatase PAP2 family protein [Allomuricauda sp. d1]|uniref:phosphatase PAP2 family protein n=1 Tax=Allomuricauda sp. d1 TaxID=3136725 RepID=UPI0031D932A1